MQAVQFLTSLFFYLTGLKERNH